MDKLAKVVSTISKKYKPLTIFLYGSRSTQTNNPDSDYEIGVIFDEENYIHHSEIRQLIPDTDIAIFPFRKDDILNYKIDTPFEKVIYTNTLIKYAKVLYGENIFLNITPKEIKPLNLLMDLRFNLGVALSSIQNYKNGIKDLANELFYKSCLYATRDLILFKSGDLVGSYDEIYEKSLVMDNEYNDLVEIAFKLRKKEITDINRDLYYRNISYINKYIEKLVEEGISL